MDRGQQANLEKPSRCLNVGTSGCKFGSTGFTSYSLCLPGSGASGTRAVLSDAVRTTGDSSGGSTAFHLPGTGHPSSLLQCQAPSRDGIRGSPRRPAGPCCLLIQTLIFSLHAQQPVQLTSQAQDPARTFSEALAGFRESRTQG